MLALILLVVRSSLGQAEARDEVSYQRDIRPIVKNFCTTCHAGENPQGDFHEPSFDEAGNQQEGYSVQFWIPHDYDQEFMAAGAFGQYLWIDRRQGTVVAQFSVGEPTLFTDGEDHITPEEFAAVMRTLARKETFR